MPQPDSDGGELDQGEIVYVVLFVARSDGSEVLQLVEEPLDQVTEAVEILAEGWDVDPSWVGLDVGPGSALSHGGAEGIAVIAAIAEQRLAGCDAIKHVGGVSAVMRLPLGELERDRVAVGIDDGVDLGGQTAPRAPHASGCREDPQRRCRRFPAQPL